MEFIDGNGAAGLASMVWLLQRLWRSRRWCMGISAKVRFRGCGRCARMLPGTATRGGWRSSTRRQDPDMFGHDVLVTKEDSDGFVA
jgi:hypothetical protein